jgi:hypothetical protein
VVTRRRTWLACGAEMDEAFNTYLQRLEEASRLYQTDVPASRILSVTATISFLRDAGTEDGLRTPLLDVLSHLSDEIQGRSGNWDSQKHNADWAFACAAVTLIAKTGRSLPEAADRVHKATGMNAKDLLQVRKNLLSGKKSRDSRSVYDSTLKAAAESGLDAESAAELSLQGLREKVRATS